MVCHQIQEVMSEWVVKWADSCDVSVNEGIIDDTIHIEFDPKESIVKYLIHGADIKVSGTWKRNQDGGITTIATYTLIDKADFHPSKYGPDIIYKFMELYYNAFIRRFGGFMPPWPVPTLMPKAQPYDISITSPEITTIWLIKQIGTGENVKNNAAPIDNFPRYIKK